ncbi:MAG: hypothetical protein M1415_08735 [Firmicutes bacterium]|jgi:hypothetical protein|nr:hypothetical protein [Bacillota bacterium]MCL5065358.1 hypothetical protein [Bacillota bacterium]
MWPHQRLEDRIVERLLRRMEPQLEQVLNDFLTTTEGQKLVVDAISDFVADFTVVPAEQNVLSLVEEVILSLTERMVSRPLFRQGLERIIRQTS